MTEERRGFEFGLPAIAAYGPACTGRDAAHRPCAWARVRRCPTNLDKIRRRPPAR